MKLKINFPGWALIEAELVFCRGLGLGVDFSYAWDTNDNDNVGNVPKFINSHTLRI